MALKGNRYIPNDGYLVNWFMNEVAERGGVASISTVGSGAALDQSVALVTYAADGSGKNPVGVVIDDMVDVDLTKYKLNQHKSEVQKGGKIVIAEKGWVRTDFAEGTITAGPLYLGHSGRVVSTYVNDKATPRVGTCEAVADEDGFFRFKFNLPMTLGM